ncbi:MAG: hypothetical protein Fur0032_21780 [Terrimicrobiaceae bacterium]
MEGEKIIQIERVEAISPRQAGGHEVQVIVNSSATDASRLRFLESAESFALIESGESEPGSHMTSQQAGNFCRWHPKAKTPTCQSAERFRERMDECIWVA